RSAPYARARHRPGSRAETGVLGGDLLRAADTASDRPPFRLRKVTARFGLGRASRRRRCPSAPVPEKGPRARRLRLASIWSGSAIPGAEGARAKERHTRVISVIAKFMPPRQGFWRLSQIFRQLVHLDPGARKEGPGGCAK